jgi:hypothetical protein
VNLPFPFQWVKQASASGDVLFLRSEHFRTLSSVLGRDSIRISSQESWDDAIFVLDLKHMPTGCATRPAFWTISATGPWPAGGEIDIIEGIPISSIIFSQYD